MNNRNKNIRCKFSPYEYFTHGNTLQRVFFHFGLGGLSLQTCMARSGMHWKAINNTQILLFFSSKDMILRWNTCYAMLYQICYETYATMLNYNVAVGSLTLFNSSFSMSYIEILTGEILFNSSFSMSCINIGLRNDRHTQHSLPEAGKVHIYDVSHIYFFANRRVCTTV